MCWNIDGLMKRLTNGEWRSYVNQFNFVTFVESWMHHDAEVEELKKYFPQYKIFTKMRPAKVGDRTN